MTKEFFITIDSGEEKKFTSKEELKDYIKNGFNRAGGFEWIEDIRDTEGNKYGCEWTLNLFKI